MFKTPPGKSEHVTRKSLIDSKLKAAGWRVVPFDPSRPLTNLNRCAIEEYPTENGPADYALCADGGILGVVEAKKLSLGPQNVLTQAERYSRGLIVSPFDFCGYHVPFLFSTNGEVIWYHDVRSESSRSRQIAKFHTPDALAEFLARDLEGATVKLRAMPNDHPRIVARPYQIDANREIEKAIEARKRQMLVAMATGTGKTFMTVNEIYRLMKSGVAKRILFLVDRRALAAQAVRTFASFEPEPGLKFNKIYQVYSQKFQREDFGEEEKFDPTVLPNSYLVSPKPGDAFVYVSTIQRMAINLFGRETVLGDKDEVPEEDAEQVENIPIHAFDLIIADECHRGYTATQVAIWRQTLEHFDAIKIGLTATPASHTTSYFKDVVFRYEYERAVREGFLVDYDVVAISSEVRMKGIFLKEGEEVGIVNSETGAKQLDLLEDERQFDTTEIEEKVTSPDSNRKILEEVKKCALEHETRYGRIPKILIFAANDLPHTSHADQLVDIARDVFGRGDSFVQKITGSKTVDRPLQRIREFRNRPLPVVVVTVDMLSTGVDIPDLECIVFLRPVKSRILFEQMLGRGTRKGDKFPDKSHFTVFDCFGGTLLEYFRNATDITAEPLEKEARTISEVIEDIWQNRDRDYNVRCLVKRLQRIDKEMSGEARDLFAAYVQSGDLGGYAKNLPKSLRQDFTGTIGLLRDAAFQKLLVEYPRAKRTFVIAYDTKDQVTSEWLVRGADGKEYKPGDYLQAFARFVEENPEHIEAIRILQKSPADWGAAALAELRNKLKAAPQRFTVENLQKVHEIQYHKALADIISMVKHAADKQNPLLTASERVERAFATVSCGRKFMPEQQQWLERIKAHLTENLSIDQEDFEILPIFARFGGWKKANGVFFGELPQLIHSFNKAVAI
ncbi:MAG: DEAD/DEAH box helicase family protein [Acidobacteriia bacterium]|nr:DEAD/DEAH box helicase family protein [Terriglobia bacterium]